jgi:hypothetical protein
MAQLDTSIIGQDIAPKFEDPQNMLLKRLQLQNMQQEYQSNALKAQQGQADYADQNALRQLIGAGTANANTPEGRAAMVKAGGIKNADAYFKSNADLGKTNADAEKIQLENHVKKFELMGQLMGGVSDQSSYDLMRAQAAKIPQLADLAPNMPPVYDPARIKQGYAQAMSVKDSMAARIAELTQSETGRHNMATEGNANFGQQVTMRGQDMTDARTREANQKPHYDADRGMMIGNNGIATPVMTGGVPLGAKDAKPSADYLKQADAYQNMDDALVNYKKVLDGFDNWQMMNPSKRAEMGTAYQNALLQAKEIYKLGVLNGGDERILKNIINNPMDLTSLMIPKDALVKQADDLQAIIKRGNDNLSKVNKQPTLALNSQATSAPTASSQDSAAMAWAKANPSDPRAAKIMKLQGR